MHLKKAASVLMMVALFSTHNFVEAKDSPSKVQTQKESQYSRIDGKQSPDKLATAITPYSQPQPPLVEKYLLDGNLADGETAMRTAVKLYPKDDQVRFGLGFLQFARAVEGLSQDLHRYGLLDVFRRDYLIPVPANRYPTVMTYQDARDIADKFREKLSEAEATMAGIKDDNVNLPLHFGMIKLDLDNDKKSGENERLWKLYASMSRADYRITEEQSKQFCIAFDRGDVHWLRGYCHFLQAVCDIYLAHDTRDTFERTGHLLFPNTDSPYAYLREGKTMFEYRNSDWSFLDLIALVHTIRWECVEPHRMKSALHHLEAMVDQSRLTWKSINAETDDNHEWLPNPEQTGVIPNVRVSKEMITSWSEIMNQIDRILEGKLLIKFWRGKDAHLGINLRKVFLQPETFDLVLWVQGSAAKPYLQHGETTNGDTWNKLMDVYGGNFPGFAAWFQ